MVLNFWIVFVVFFSIYFIGVPFTRLLQTGDDTNSALMATVSSALIAGVTIIRLDDFLPQALCTPFLLIWPYMLYRALNQTHWKNIFLAASVFAAATAIYTEFYLLFIGAGLVAVILQSFQKQRNIYKTISCFVTICILAQLMNIGYAVSGYLLSTVFKFIHSSFLSRFAVIYPWKNPIDGFNEIWVGPWWTLLPITWSNIIGLVSIILLTLAFWGLANTAWRRKDSLSFSLLSLAAVPFLLLPDLLKYQYQYYKLLFSMSPFYVLGIYLLMSEYKFYVYRSIRYSLMSIMLVSMGATFFLSAMELIKIPEKIPTERLDI